VARVSTRGPEQRLESGPLSIEITIDSDGRLAGVFLPKAVPEGITPQDLSNLLAQLQEFELLLNGAPFLRKVWERMRQIPWGHALTYGELAAEIGSPRAVRAVGQACARNPLPLIVPCHRVLAETGLGGFSCGLPWKTALLELENEARPV
jgi:O-6-methylguanine DNA methyltransferase